MASYNCSDSTCGMGVTGLSCAKCGSPLEHNDLVKPDGSVVGVSQCPKGCGKIKSPSCCGEEMSPVSKW